jgi:hypothetical protein
MQSPKASKREIARATSVLQQTIDSANQAHERITAVNDAGERRGRHLDARCAALSARLDKIESRTFWQRVFGD